MFQLPESFTLALAPPSKESIDSGIRTMIEMVSSCYDDVAVNGCASVAKLAAGSESTKFNMANHRDLVSALFNVVVGDLSLDTITNAALALADLTSEPVGQATLVSIGSKHGESPLTLLAEKARFPAHSDDRLYEVLSFRRFWYVTVRDVVSHSCRLVLSPMPTPTPHSLAR